MSDVIEWLNSSLKNIEHNLFKDVVKIEDADKKPMGDGQIIIISDIGRVTLTLVTKNGERKQINVIAKFEAKAGAGRDLASTWGAFDTEIKMYTKILKSMEKLMSEEDDKEYIWAECYHCGDNKLLFQDLCDDGYKIVPTYKFLDVEHALLVMKAIGKFHGMAMVLKQRNQLDSSPFKTPYYARKHPFMDVAQLKTIASLTEVIENEWGPEWSSVPERVKKYFEKPGEKIYNAWDSTRGQWDVLNHGDFSMRNMLFHYPPDSDHPDGIRFVDFQMSHYSNLANDLVTLLYSSLRPQIRDENMDLLLNTYINSLTSTTKKYGYSGPLPTIQDIKSSLRALTPVIFAQLLFAIPFFIRSGKEDVQKKTDEMFGKYETLEEMAKARAEDQDNNDLLVKFSDKDVKECLQYELKRLMNENAF